MQSTMNSNRILRRRHKNDSIYMVGVIIIILTFTLSQHLATRGNLDSLVSNAIKVSLIHLENSIDEVSDTTLFPTYGTKELKWKLNTSEQWTSGFYPGCLWYAYELSKDPRFERWARQWTASLECEKFNIETHDLGFKFMCTFGNGLRLGKGEAYSTYKDIILTAANTLSKRYNPKVGCLSSNWDVVQIENSFPVVIDIMMNLELLFWASQNGGPSYWADYAVNHAVTTYRDFVRPDGGTYHIVRYDSNSGKIISRGTLQGAGDETTWSRGHAWAVYGMVVVYRYTRDKRFLDMVMRLADYFIKNLEEDRISAWDFQSDIKYRDVSATCIVASALFEMTNYTDDESLKKHYEREAESMLISLCKEPYFLDGARTNCLLNHSVHYLPINTNVDVPAIFADYYFLEALTRYKTQHKTE